ncbi:hypothetical protein FHG68_18965 [Leptospira weilii]|nr:hypothetical protein FHG67_18910 [Leptospira weilii]QDK28504.1 hypothetical protein FHG68_18965 [Leptospira weilii]
MLRLYRKVIEPDFYTLTSKKQMKIDFQEKMIEFAEKEYSVDTKKFGSKHFCGIGKNDLD